MIAKRANRDTGYILYQICSLRNNYSYIQEDLQLLHLNSIREGAQTNHLSTLCRLQYNSRYITSTIPHSHHNQRLMKLPTTYTLHTDNTIHQNLGFNIYISVSIIYLCMYVFLFCFFVSLSC